MLRIVAGGSSASACRILLHRLAQLLRQLRDLLVGGAVLERLAKLLLGGAEFLGGERQVAVLDAERDRPEIVDDPAQRVVVARLDEPVVGAAQREIVAASSMSI